MEERRTKARRRVDVLKESLDVLLVLDLLLVHRAVLSLLLLVLSGDVSISSVLGGGSEEDVLEEGEEGKGEDQFRGRKHLKTMLGYLCKYG